MGLYPLRKKKEKKGDIPVSGTLKEKKKAIHGIRRFSTAGKKKKNNGPFPSSPGKKEGKKGKRKKKSIRNFSILGGKKRNVEEIL